MTTPLWVPGKLYSPGDLVRPRSATGGVAVPPDNPDFEIGTFTDWTPTADGGSGSGAISATYHFTGAKSFLWAGGAGCGEGGGIGCFLVNDLRSPIAAGQTITARCYSMSVPLHRERHVHSGVRLFWFDASGDPIAADSSGGFGSPGTDLDGYGQFGGGFGTTGAWRQSSITATAPAGAVFVSIGAFLTSTQGDANGAYVDSFTWDYISPAISDALVFRAVQPVAGFSGSEEPAWPVVLGETVYDNEVTWEAVATSRVVWEATPILVSGAVEPDFPDQVGGAVNDNSIVWHAVSRRIADEKCPHSKIVAIAASKIFAGDNDIIAYCSTVNPLDWSTKNDAGYLPFGLNTYGSNPVAALGLYRSNLVASSSSGYQMWQVDPNPANMAYLDGQPVPFEYHLSLQPAANDLVGLTNLGIRSVGIAGASTNLQAGFFGKAVDPLVKPLIAAALEVGFVPMGIMWPAAGQYWLIFGTSVIVLTINGPSEKDMSWSRYEFPQEITDWTIDGLKLLLRAGDLVWEMSDDANADGPADDVYCDPSAPVLTGSHTLAQPHLEWTPSIPVEGTVLGYRVYDADTSELLGTTDPDVLEFDPAQYENETKHFFVQAFDSAGEQNSNIAAIAIGGPQAVTLSGVINADITKADLSWTASTSTGGVLLGYKLYRDGVLHQTQSGLTFQDTGLANDTTYSYIVRPYTALTPVGPDSDEVQLDTGHPETVTEIFTSNDTWIKRIGLISVDVTVIPAGGGGGSGSVHLGAEASPGGSGGGGSARSTGTFLAAALDSTEAITVGTGGPGGASVAALLATNGNPGTAGGSSSFGSHLSATGGGLGTGGSTLNLGGDGGVGTSNGGDGADSTLSGSTTPGGSSTHAAGGGGFGGGYNFDGSHAGSDGGDGSTSDSNQQGGTFAQGFVGEDGEDAPLGECGGGGSGGSNGGAGFGTTGKAGGKGGYPGGGGGGGGQATSGGSTGTSGAGGDGEDGIVIVVNHLS